MIEDGYRYSKVKIVSWIIAILLGMVAWYYIGYFSNKIYRCYYPDDFKPTYRTSVRLLER
jgi:hypothetical protein